MKHLVGLCSVVLACAAVAAQPAEPPGSLAAERARIAVERKRVADRVLQEQRACHQRFAVNNCLEATRVWQRDALDDLRRQEILLNDGERERKAAKRLQRLDDRQQERQQDQAERARAATPSPGQRSAPQPSGGRLPGVAAPRTPDAGKVEQYQEEMRRKQQRHVETEQRRADQAANAPDAADKQAERLREATEHKARILKRNADQPSKAGPLPPPS